MSPFMPKLTARQRDLLLNPKPYIAESLARLKKEKDKATQGQPFGDATVCYRAPGLHRHFLYGPPCLFWDGERVIGSLFDCGEVPDEPVEDWDRVSDETCASFGHTPYFGPTTDPAPSPPEHEKTEPYDLDDPEDAPSEYEIRVPRCWFLPTSGVLIPVTIQAHWMNSHSKRGPGRPRKGRGAQRPIIRLENTTNLGGKTHERTRQREQSLCDT